MILVSINSWPIHDIRGQSSYIRATYEYLSASKTKGSGLAFCLFEAALNCFPVSKGAKGKTQDLTPLFHFSVKVPSKRLRKAMKQADINDLSRYDSIEDMMSDLKS